MSRKNEYRKYVILHDGRKLTHSQLDSNRMLDIQYNLERLMYKKTMTETREASVFKEVTEYYCSGGVLMSQVSGYFYVRKQSGMAVVRWNRGFNRNSIRRCELLQYIGWHTCADEAGRNGGCKVRLWCMGEAVKHYRRKRQYNVLGDEPYREYQSHAVQGILLWQRFGTVLFAWGG